ncbi:methyltransferase domain-containing protein [Aliiglaciecola sp. 2_MG-2023]|uniref:class I SAM-dependent methyltransferase n=1 Tax=unclassified Aliiglaciecola TaxID=2593648 RepID=UPI0026E14A6E|nr:MULTISPECIES: class I SAM-dependent methyltransferase [unclassified Aliiglaciecola]MDO6712744.1 methyltransferase domain-containing protein [Aliiglaciecola sp. 2_MG-2023]MDO6753857.1 methyltransferase domain-containing protein [Aliiglaciecola sp. 1_MG-2023]
MSVVSHDERVSEHYLHGDLLSAIEAALCALGKTSENLTLDDLAPVDEFHIGGRLATDHLIDQLKFSKRSHLLDVGCGLGGAARHLASKHESRVTGIDLTSEYVETGNALSGWLNLDEYIRLYHGSALSMPFQDNMFDGGYMLHVGMNIENKTSLFCEIYRVLKPGSAFGVYDVMRQNDGELIYPVPWATESSNSKLATPSQYKKALSDAGFAVSSVNNRGDFAIDFFRQLRAKTQSSSDTSPLGLHILMQDNTALKMKNMIENINNGLVAPVEIIAKKV